MFTLAISCLTTSNLHWYMDLTFQVPMQYLLFTASGLASITSHIHSWVWFLLWLCVFILSGVISPVFSSNILGTYRPEELIFHCHIFLPFHTVHGALKARILNWFAIPFSSGPHFVRTLHLDPSVLGGPTWHNSQFNWVRQGCGPCDQFHLFSVIVVFIWSALWGIRIRSLQKLPDGRDWLWGKLGLIPKCSSWVQSQKWQNDLCSFPGQTIQYHSNLSPCPNQ